MMCENVNDESYKAIPNVRIKSSLTSEEIDNINDRLIKMQARLDNFKPYQEVNIFGPLAGVFNIINNSIHKLILVIVEDENITFAAAVSMLQDIEDFERVSTKPGRY